MKVAFYVYPVAFQSPGGGEILLLKTKEYLEKEGLEITLFNPWSDKLQDFDILHTFGSVKDSLRMMQVARMRGVRNVLSTICWYSWKSAWHTYSGFKQKTLAIGRQVAKSFFPFIPSARKAMMQVADLLIPNSQTEADQLKRYFLVDDNKISVVYNGTDPHFAEAHPQPFVSKFGFKDFVLCVGRIEPRKNQLNVVRALRGLDLRVVFIGEAVPGYEAYEQRCKKEAGPNMHFLGAIPHNSSLLSSAYAACNVFLLASWLETPGLAALEAGLAGAKVVITDQGATKEYFGDTVWYCSPDSLQSIRNGVLQAWNSPARPTLKARIQERFLWFHTARKTLQCYEKVLH